MHRFLRRLFEVPRNRKQRRAARARRAHFTPGVERLEDRKLMAADLVNGTLSIVGTARNDAIFVNLVGSDLQVKVNRDTSTFALADVQAIDIRGLEGNDLIVVDQNILLPTTINGDAGNDQIKGGGGADVVHGGAGNDLIFGLGGSDDLYGDDGNDRLDGGVGDDKASGGAGNDLLYGGDGSDKESGDAGNDLLFGGGGDDDLSGDDGNDRLDGGDGNDKGSGGSGNDLLFGGAGDDSLSGDDGNDLEFGDAGNDDLAGGSGDDRLDGGSGDDRLRAGTGNDRLFGRQGKDDLSGDDGNDRLEGGDDDDLLHGDAGNDSIYGGTGTDKLYGDDGNDQEFGDDGDDDLSGDAGDDRIDGGRGNDHVHGGLGRDSLYGGSGRDRLDDDGDGNRFGYDRDDEAGEYHNNGESSIELEVQLSGAPYRADAKFKSEIEDNGRVKETFIAGVRGAAAGDVLDVVVGGLNVGQIKVDAYGNGRLVLSSFPDGVKSQPFPTGFPQLTPGVTISVGAATGQVAAPATGGQSSELEVELRSGAFRAGVSFETETDDGAVKSTFRAYVKVGTPGTTVDVVVADTTVGQIVVDGLGRGQLVFSTKGGTPFPDGFPEIKRGTSVKIGPAVGTLGTAAPVV